MRKGITLAALCMLGALIFSTTAMAYDYLFSDDTAAVKAVGGLSGSIGFAYVTAGSGWDADGDSFDYTDDLTFVHVPIRAYYGLTDKVTLFGMVSAFSKWDQGDAGESGIGDVWLGAKYAVLPALTLRGVLDIPTGDEKKDLGYKGGLGIDVAAMTSRTFGKIGFNGQAGLRYAAEDGDTKWQPGVGVYFDAEGFYSFTESFAGKFGAELASIGDGKTDGKDTKDSGYTYFDLRAGGAYKICDKLALNANLYYTVAGVNAYEGLSFLVNLGYTVK